MYECIYNIPMNYSFSGYSSTQDKPAKTTLKTRCISQIAQFIKISIAGVKSKKYFCV